MTPLGARMIKVVQMHGFSPRTHESYLAAVKDLARYHHRSPDTIAMAGLNGYLEHLVTERKLAPASIRLAPNAIRFLFVEVLKWPRFELGIAFPKRLQRIPELLTRAEMARSLAACTDPRYRMTLTLCYGCGLPLVKYHNRSVPTIRCSPCG